MTASLLRSWLYVPGNRLDRLEKALASGADAIILDLEDAVPPAEKDAARAAVCEALASRRRGEGAELWVRINAGAATATDLEALAAAAPTLTHAASAQEAQQAAGALRGVVVSKATLDSTWALAGWARQRDVRVSPLLETARGVIDAREMATVPGVFALQIGEYDLAAELGLTPGPDEAELAPYRAQVILASSAARIMPPPAPVSNVFSDVDAFRVSCERAARQGFLGRACIHPAQVPVVHDVARPSKEEVEAATRIVEALKAATASGDGVIIDDAGRMIDAAHVRSARLVLARADC